MKHFRVYVLHSHVIVYVPSNVVKSILTQPNLEGKRAKWIVVLLEYDIENKPTKLIKGKGLARMMKNSNCEALQLNFLTSHSNQLDTGVHVVFEFSMYPWYYDIVYVLQNLQYHVGLSKTRARSVKLKDAKFCILNQYFYWMDPRGVLLNCVLENESQQITKDFHEGYFRGHHLWKVTANKIFRVRFY